MKILIVSGCFYPTNAPRAFRTTELVKEFGRLGHSVRVYFPENNYNYSEFIKNNPNVEISFMPQIHGEAPKNKFGYAIWRIANILAAYPSVKYYTLLKKVLEKENNYDLLVSVAVPHPIHWGIGNIYKKRKIARTWIADCGDPYMLCKTDSHNAPGYMRYFEDLWCKKCDYISVPTETSYTGYYPEYHNKIKVIPQGFNFDAVKVLEYKKNYIPTFAFAGSFIPGRRDPRKLFEYLCTIEKPFKFFVYGTSDKNRWSGLLSKLEGKVFFEKPIPRAELLPKLSQMDFLINIGNGTKVQTPSKLIDYTLVKRPILTIETNDIKENILSEFLEGNYANQDAPIDISRYDIHNVAQQFLSLCR